jgi:hypothetical protein
MKRLCLLISVTALILGLSACGPEPKNIYSKGKPGFGSDIKFLGSKEIPEIGTINLMCIDGVKYIVTDKGGISPKFTAWENADPSVEECNEGSDN